MVPQSSAFINFPQKKIGSFCTDTEVRKLLEMDLFRRLEKATVVFNFARPLFIL